MRRTRCRFYLPLDEGEEMAYCCLERHRGEKVTAFHLHREDTGAFILACSCASDMEGPFKFHTLTDSHLRRMEDIPSAADSAVYLGMMEINFLGTEFVVRDHRWDDPSGTRFSHELGLTVYETNVSGRAPNSMKVVVPRLHADQITADNAPDLSLSDRFAKVNTTRVRGGKLKRWFPKTAAFVARRRGSAADAPLRIAASTPTAGPGAINRSFSNIKRSDAEDDEDAQEYCALEGDEMLDMTVFHTKKPVWNDELHAWTLNFNGRAKRASKKNFLLTPPVEGSKEGTTTKDDGRVYLRFGKMSKARFSLDFRDPFSPLVALGVAITTFAKKRAVT